MTIGRGYSSHFQSAIENETDWYKTDDLRDHFNHTLPVKLTLAIQVKPSHQPYPTSETQLWAYQQTQSFYFDRLFNRLSEKMHNLLIEQQKLNLLYSFHFFF